LNFKKENVKNYQLILASQSPRRRQLLTEAGFVFSVRPTDTDETLPPQYEAEKVAQWLAQKKAAAALEWLENDQQIIIAADTVVILDGEIFGKPETHAEAFAMIRRLANRTHKVVTGVCLRSRLREVAFSDEALVTFDDFSDEEINFYIQTCQPFDKAGSYGIQEWLGLCKILRIEGTYANVMGLPVHLIYAALKNF
jgi:septum formation protein